MLIAFSTSFRLTGFTVRAASQDKKWPRPMHRLNQVASDIVAGLPGQALLISSGENGISLQTHSSWFRVGTIPVSKTLFDKLGCDKATSFLCFFCYQQCARTKIGKALYHFWIIFEILSAQTTSTTHHMAVFRLLLSLWLLSKPEQLLGHLHQYHLSSLLD